MRSRLVFPAPFAPCTSSPSPAASANDTPDKSVRSPGTHSSADAASIASDLPRRKAAILLARALRARRHRLGRNGDETREHLAERLDQHRPREEEPLQLVAALGLEEPVLGLRLDALGDHREA